MLNSYVSLLKHNPSNHSENVSPLTYKLVKSNFVPNGRFELVVTSPCWLLNLATSWPSGHRTIDGACHPTMIGDLQAAWPL